MASIKARTLRDGSTSWQVQIRRSGYPPISRSFPTEREARDFAILTEASVLKNETINPREATKWTIPEIVEWYKKNPHPERKLSNRKHFQRLNFVADEFEHFTAQSLTSKILSTWITKRLKINSPATVYHYYVALKNAMIHHSVQHGYSQHIFNVAKCPTKSGERNRRFSLGETRELFRSIHYTSENKKSEMRVTILFAIETACRIGEMLQLTWDHVSMDERWIEFPSETTKTKEYRRIPITTVARNILRWVKSHHYNKALSPSQQRVFSFWNVNEHHLSRQFRICCGRAGITDIRWHDLRHEATSRFFEKTTMTDMEVAYITGHRTLTMLQRYTHLRPSTIVHKLW